MSQFLQQNYCADTDVKDVITGISERKSSDLSDSQVRRHESRHGQCVAVYGHLYKSTYIGTQLKRFSQEAKVL